MYRFALGAAAERKNWPTPRPSSPPAWTPTRRRSSPRRRAGSSAGARTIRFPIACSSNRCRTSPSDAWQGGETLPDAALGWAMLNVDGGHPGDATHQVIRRWTAPAAGTLHIEGELGHTPPEGDGVRGRSSPAAAAAWRVDRGHGASADAGRIR